jgi:senataxin
MLTIQYRMQTNIRKFISSTFYDNKLIDSTDNEYIKKINNEVFYQAIDINKNFSFFDLKFSEENYDGKIKSYYNEDEINFTNEFILKINNSLKKVGNSTNEKKYNYAIITPYQAQVKRFKEKFIINNIEIAINTVDSFQGQERDIVLFSTVRSSKKNNSINDNQGGGESIGFLKDFRRMNVALSRAKLGCFIIGNSQKLISNSYWEKLINFCKMKKCFYMIDSPKEFNQSIENIFL